MGKYHLKWTNIYSGEVGYVGKVSQKAGHFFNADKDGAKSYNSVKMAERDIKILEQLGEAENNRFKVVEF